MYGREDRKRTRSTFSWENKSTQNRWLVEIVRAWIQPQNLSKWYFQAYICFAWTNGTAEKTAKNDMESWI